MWRNSSRNYCTGKEMRLFGTEEAKPKLNRTTTHDINHSNTQTEKKEIS